MSRLVIFDKRGSGLSDRPADVSADQWVTDARAVLDAVGSKHTVLVGVHCGAPIAAMCAAEHPERTSALVPFAASPRILVDDDYPFGWDCPTSSSSSAPRSRRSSPGRCPPPGSGSSRPSCASAAPRSTTTTSRSRRSWPATRAGTPEGVLVTSTVRDLLVGSGIEFDHRGRRSFDAVPGDWDIHAVVPG
jgi:pimeloyl-ACP methyl ester carboxylesterase